MSWRIPLNLNVSRSSEAVRRVGEPVTTGIPMPKGLLVDARLVGAVQHGVPLPTQARALDHWSDGSIRWLLVDTAVSFESAGEVIELLPYQPRVETEPDLASIQPGGVVVTTGGVLCRCRTGDRFLEVDHPGTTPVVPAIRITDVQGMPVSTVWRDVAVIEPGPLRTTIEWRGSANFGSDTSGLRLVLRAQMVAATAVVRFQLQILNPSRAEHPGNFWELGDHASVLIGDVVCAVPAWPGDGQTVHLSLHRGETCGAVRRVSVTQASSGGAHWQSPAHVGANGDTRLAWRGYVADIDGTSSRGDRATPVIVVRTSGGQVAVADEYFWENFPRAIEADPQGLMVALLSSVNGPIELQGGERKTLEWAVAFGPDPVTETPLAWCRTPLVVHAQPTWYAASGVLGALPTLGTEPAYDTLVAQAVDGPDAFVAKRERIDEYGWRHFGDIYADHEAVFHTGPGLLVSHYNNQYDGIAGCTLQFFRTADVRWWLAARELTRHVVDIDLYHTDADKSAYSGGLFWHTYHYVDAGRSTHRAYPQAPGVPGGGPSCEHNYNTGLLLQYFMRGDIDARDAVVQLARWVIQIDDGAQTPFRWLDRGPTGAASATADVMYHGPGRGPGNSIVALLNGYRLTADPTWLAAADGLIRRCIHPDDDVAARDLLDAERRWSYTVFLQAVGRYLDDNLERGRIGETFEWARRALVRYARWMAAFEYPYLDMPERLEYPTETWAAQDIRKADVFAWAARYSTDADERAGFRERASFFLRSSTATLLRLSTRTLARPVVILLGNGLMAQQEVASPSTVTLPEHVTRLNVPRAPAPFVPQRVRAIRRVVWVTACGAIGAVVAFGWWFVR